MIIADGDRDALEIVKDIKAEMETIRDLIATLEYVVYRCDDRVEIDFFERGEDDKKGS